MASPGGRGRPVRLSLLLKLLAAYAVPTLALFSVFAWVAYDITRRDLEAELGRRLAGIAASTAAVVRGRYLIEMEPAEDEPTPRVYQNTLRKLETLRGATGVARIYVFRPDGTSLCDTRPGVPIGHLYHEVALDRHELAKVLQPPGDSSSTLLFRGSDGRLYKAGYAPVRASEDDPTIVGALRVEAPAEFFDRLRQLRSRLISYGAILAAVVVAVTLVVAARITRPVRRLSAAAERIAGGDLAAPVAAIRSLSTPRDEIGFLAKTFDEMREALRARDERLQMMLAGIAHEVRNPLGGIELFTGILRDEIPADDERYAHVKRIEKELGHLKAVVSDFLEYARRPKPDLRALELAPFLSDVRDLALADAKSGGVEIRLDGPTPPDLHASADPVQLKRALLNLLRNAVQATPPGGAVTLAARRRLGDRVVLRVSDTGKGIPKEQLDKIFTPFFTTKEKGTGLGLAFVREIVTDHGGTLSVESNLGQGSSFTVELNEWA
jgi:signal transduction histidine kinase